jgi:hypothetical protein
MSFDKARDVANTVKSIEKEIILQIRNVLNEARQKKYLSSKQLDTIDDYMSTNRAYFNGQSFNQSELNLFNEAMNLFLGLMFEREYRAKKEMLEKQMEVFDAN